LKKKGKEGGNIMPSHKLIERPLEGREKGKKGGGEEHNSSFTLLLLAIQISDGATKKKGERKGKGACFRKLFPAQKG